jgi:hypothetical protein
VKAPTLSRREKWEKAGRQAALLLSLHHGLMAVAVIMVVCNLTAYELLW